MIDPVAKRVTTIAEHHEADFLVVALGADYDFAATPGRGGATEFYTVAGAARLAKILRRSPGATSSSASAARLSNARRRPAKRR